MGDKIKVDFCGGYGRILVMEGSNMTINAFTELEEVLRKNGKTIEDIQGVRVNQYRMKVDIFLSHLSKLYYDNGYGTHVLSDGLYVLGKGWWLSRREYDGAEWWEFNKRPLNRGRYVDEIGDILDTDVMGMNNNTICGTLFEIKK